MSLNKTFQKVPRRKDEPGKGGFWRINPDHSDTLASAAFKRRNASMAESVIPSPPVKRIKTEPVDYIDFETYGNNSGKTITDDQTLNSSEWSEVLNGGSDFSWNTIMKQDIVIGGITIKTGDLFNGGHQGSCADNAAGPITSLSPPPSETNSDILLEAFLASDLSTELESPTESPDSQPLDFSLSGLNTKISIGQGWWSEESNTKGLGSPPRNSGLNTPPPSSPVHGETAELTHSWYQGKTDIDVEAMTDFDLDIQNMFSFSGLS